MSTEDERIVFLFETINDLTDRFRVIILEKDFDGNKSIIDIIEFDITENFDYRSVSRMIRINDNVNEFTKIQIGFSLFSGKHFHQEHDVPSTIAFNRVMNEAIHLIKMG